MASSVYVDLKLNRSLINSNFNGYKLSLDALPVYRTSLETGIDVVKLPDNLYSYQHLKAFGIHNHIYLDPWNERAVYFVDERWHVMKAVIQGHSFNVLVEHFIISDAANRRLIPNRLNVSLHFTTASLLVLSDGTGRLFILHTGNRTETAEWKVGYFGRPLGSDDDEKYFVILNSVFRNADNSCYIEVLVIHVDKNPLAADDNNEPSFITQLEWLTFYSDNASTFDLKRLRRLEGSVCPDYAALLPDGSAVVLLAEKPFSFSYDSVKPVIDTTDDQNVADEVKSEPLYTWSQSNEDITVFIKLLPGVSKADVNIQLLSDRIQLSLKDGDAILCGEFFDKVVVDASTWIINDDHVLEIHLTKSAVGPWSTFIVGDTRGEVILTAEQMDAINEQLDKFTSSSENADPQEGRKLAFNTQQLEECDMFPEDSSSIWCLDGETHKKIQQVNVSSNQWLFNATTSPDHPPAICLRHDVDGIVWQLVPSESSGDAGNSLSWRHVGTFDAFGYVIASKQQRKFTTCSPSLSYVAVADCVRHIYIYRRPTSISSSVRNRRTGETVASVARQQLISLESTEDITGFRASNTDIFIMSGKTLHAVRVNDWTE